MSEIESPNPYEFFSPRERQVELRNIISQLPHPISLSTDDPEIEDVMGKMEIIERKNPREFEKILEEMYNEMSDKISKRENSEHKHALEGMLSRLLEYAHITPTFKSHILEAFQDAYTGALNTKRFIYNDDYELFPGYLEEVDDPESLGIFDLATAKRIERRQYWTEFLNQRHLDHEMRLMYDSPEQKEWFEREETNPDSPTNQISNWFGEWGTEFFALHQEQI